MNGTLSHLKLLVCPNLFTIYPLKFFTLPLVSQETLVIKQDIKKLLNKIFGQHFEVFSKFAASGKGFLYFLN